MKMEIEQGSPSCISLTLAIFSDDHVLAATTCPAVSMILSQHSSSSLFMWLKNRLMKMTTIHLAPRGSSFIDTFYMTFALAVSLCCITHSPLPQCSQDMIATMMTKQMTKAVNTDNSRRMCRRQSRSRKENNADASALVASLSTWDWACESTAASYAACMPAVNGRRAEDKYKRERKGAIGEEGHLALQSIYWLQNDNDTLKQGGRISLV